MMSQPHNMRQRTGQTALAWSVPLMVEVSALVRSLALAWGIGAADLGRALILALTLRLVEMLSDVGIDRMVQVSPRRDDPDFLTALHGASLLRGLVLCLVLVALAGPMSWAFADGAQASSFALLAIIPLLRGALHLEYRLEEARGQYARLAMVEGMAALMMLAALPVMIIAFGDERAMVGLLVVQACGQLGFSHLSAVQRYAARLDWMVLRDVLRFGAPLALNAGLMFLALQADRLLVAGFYGWAEVAAYAVAFQLAFLPAQIAGRAAASTLTARLAKDDGVFVQSLWQFAALAALFALGFALLAPAAIALAYGAELRPTAGLALALGVAAGLRIARTPLSVRAVAIGRTADPARANLWRAGALALALGAALMGLPLYTVALAGALGEAAALGQAARLAMPSRPSKTFSQTDPVV